MIAIDLTKFTNKELAKSLILADINRKQLEEYWKALKAEEERRIHGRI